MKENAYTYIKERILNCEYYPGQTISEKEILESIGTGRTPVREALITLQKENLIEIYSRKGTCAKSITAKDVMELYQLRKIIEPTVAVTSKRRFDYARLLEFDSRFEEASEKENAQTAREFFSLDVEFHQMIVDTTGNDRLMRMFRELMQETYRIGIYSAQMQVSNSRASTCCQHRRIIQAILSERDSEIETTLITHINRSLLSSLQAVKIAGLSAAAP